MPVATYPGTVTPLRGLGSFAESERDVFFGRDQERDQLARIVTKQSYRAGLLYGESGVGRTSLLQAGLQPDLRDHGVVALFCLDNLHPLDSFAQALSNSTGQIAKERETAASFLTRVISQAAQMYLFILDDIDLAMAQDERVTSEVAELFTRVASRSAGRARFLFSCASDRVHSFAALEMRTGSLFPPASRYELCRMQIPEATMVLERTIALAGIPCQEDVAPAVIASLGSSNTNYSNTAGPSGLILPSELQIAAIALKDLGINSAAQFQHLGGYRELESRWILASAEATGNEHSAMRLLAVLAAAGHAANCPVTWIASQAGVDLQFTQSALVTLQTKGLVQGNSGQNAEELYYSLCHEILEPRLREQAAPAKMAAKKAYEILESKAAQDKILSRRELMELRREGIVASTPQEQAVIAKTQRFTKFALIAVAVVPLLIITIAYISMSGAYYLDTTRGKEGIETIVVRAGKPSLSWLNWLPKSPAFGSIVADTGLTQRMVTKETWASAQQNDISGSLSDAEYIAQVRSARRPGLAALLDYAQTGDDASLKALSSYASSPTEYAKKLHILKTIAHGSSEEVAIVEAALSDPSKVVFAEAIAVAAAAEARSPGSYAASLTEALSSPEAERRNMALSVLRSLPSTLSHPLLETALAATSEKAAKRDLQAALGSASAALAPKLAPTPTITSAGISATELLDPKLSAVARRTARRELHREFRRNPPALQEALPVLLTEELREGDRQWLLEEFLSLAPPTVLQSAVNAVESSLKSSKPTLRGSALVLLAKASPNAAATELIKLFDEANLPKPMRVAAATAWGYVALDVDNRLLAKASLEKLLKNEDRNIRGAAAQAFGFVGRSAQEPLSAIVKKDFADVAQLAAMGLVNSVQAGAPAGNAVAGIRPLWKKKGRHRRSATAAFARLALYKPESVTSLLASSLNLSDDPSLAPIAMGGYCNMLQKGSKSGSGPLIKAASHSQLDLRTTAIDCVIDFPDNKAVAAKVAAAMAGDASATIRSKSAKVLASLAAQSVQLKLVGKALSRLIRDTSREVRVLAIEALPFLGGDLPKNAVQLLHGAFQQADEAEKLLVLRVSTQLGSNKLISQAISDTSAIVRMAALGAALATKTEVAATISAALTDQSAAVRRAALEKLSQNEHGLSSGEVDEALSLAIRDQDPSIADLAMMTSATLGDPEQVEARLKTALQDRSEIVRAKAAAACAGLVAKTAKRAITLLEPLLNDPSHDVRVAMLPPLAAAYATSLSQDELKSLLAHSETRANRRFVVTAAFFLAGSKSPAAEASTIETLSSIEKKGPPFAKEQAALASQLLQSSADGIAFLSFLVP